MALSTDMAERLRTKGVAPEKLAIIRNGTDTRAVTPVEDARGDLQAKLNPDSRFVLMYAGNLGFAQDWDTLFSALEQLKAPRGCWVFVLVGDGVMRPALEARARSSSVASNVHFAPRQDHPRLSELLCAGTLHIVPLKRGLHGCVAASKVYSIMAAGRPYLAISDAECEFARVGLERGYGLWAQAGDADAIAERIDWAIAHPEELAAIGRTARAYAVAEHDVRLNHASWRQLLRRIAQPGAASTHSDTVQRPGAPVSRSF